MVKVKFLNMALFSLALATSSFAAGNKQNIDAAARVGNFEQVRLLLENGAKVDAADGHGYTALHSAAIRGQTILVDLLLAFGADINKVEASVKTPLCLAAMHAKYDVVELLIKRGATVEREHRDAKYINDLEIALSIVLKNALNNVDEIAKEKRKTLVSKIMNCGIGIYSLSLTTEEKQLLNKLLPAEMRISL